MIKNDIQLKSIYKKNVNLKTRNIFKKSAQRFNEIFLKTPKYYKKDPTNYFWKDFYKNVILCSLKRIFQCNASKIF